jgi:hypothetical protein
VVALAPAIVSKAANSKEANMSFCDVGIVLAAGEGKAISVLGNPNIYKAVKEEPAAPMR